MSEPHEPPPFDPAACKPVTETAELATIRLVSMYFTSGGPEPAHRESGATKEQLKLSVSGEHSLDRVAGQLACRLVFEAHLSDNEAPIGDETSQPPTAEPAGLFLGATYQATYHLGRTDGIDDEAFEMFAYWNGLLTLWPYWRELVSSTTDRAGVSFTVPVFRLPAS